MKSSYDIAKQMRKEWDSQASQSAKATLVRRFNWGKDNKRVAAEIDNRLAK